LAASILEWLDLQGLQGGQMQIESANRWSGTRLFAMVIIWAVARHVMITSTFQPGGVKALTSLTLPFLCLGLQRSYKPRQTLVFFAWTSVLNSTAISMKPVRHLCRSHLQCMHITIPMPDSNSLASRRRWWNITTMYKSWWSLAA